MKAPARPTPGTTPSRRFHPAMILALTLGAAAVAMARAIPPAWVTDDAYISFRYAEHLLLGHGLVFNAGERVEGYSNFLWTLWSALGMRLGFEPERWANAWSLGAYVAVVLGLGAVTLRRVREPGAFPIPLAALLFALQREAAVFATGGLETAAFTGLASAGILVLTGPRPGLRRCALSSALLALATLTRLDGAIFLLVGGAAVLLVARPRGRATTAFLLGAAAILLPYLAWKWWYYGAILPNTYHAKSATAAWWSQGGVYLGLYLLRYPALAMAVLLGAAVLIATMRSKRTDPSRAAEKARGRVRSVTVEDARSLEDSPASRTARTLAILMAASVIHTLAVVRVGGDFMFGRFLIPVTPLLLAALELSIGGIGRNRAWLRWSLAALACAGILWGADPVRSRGIVSGIVHEEAANAPGPREEMRRSGLVLRRYVDGLPLRVAFGGSQAIVAYTSRVRYALETSTGLTDPELARMPIGQRGRVGHEKKAPCRYLIEYRRAHFIPFTSEGVERALSVSIPIVHMDFDGLPCTILTWESAVMDSLRRRGAVVEDFRERVQELVRIMPALPDSVVQEVYAKLRRFYFVYGQDRQLEEAILVRLKTRG